MHIAEKRKATRIAKLVGVLAEEERNQQIYKSLVRRLVTAGDPTYPRHLAQQDIMDSYKCSVCHKGHETCKCGEDEDNGPSVSKESKECVSRADS
jgi:hypothetical protein